MASRLPHLEPLLAAYFQDRAAIAVAILFGSVARWEDHAGSDLDVGILLCDRSSATAFNRAEIATDLMRITGRSRVDVVLLDTAPPLLQHRVVRDGHVVFCRDSQALAEFTIRAIQRYEDTRPLRALQDRRRRALLEDLRR